MKKLNIEPEMTTRDKCEIGFILTLSITCLIMMAYIGSQLI